MLLQLLIDRTGWVANFAFCWLQNTKLWPTMMHFYCKWCCFICNNLVQLIHILGISSAKEGKKHQCMSCKTSKDLNGVSAFVLVYMSYSSLTIVLFFLFVLADLMVSLDVCLRSSVVQLWRSWPSETAGCLLEPRASRTRAPSSRYEPTPVLHLCATFVNSFTSWDKLF